MPTHSIVFILFSFLLFSACQPAKKLPDVSSIDVVVEIERFDKEFGELKPDQILKANAAFQEKYGVFYDDYMKYLLEAGDPQDTLQIQKILQTVVRTRDFNELVKAIRTKYPNLDQQEKDLAKAYQYLIYYFPETKIPRFVSYFSGFGAQVSTGDGYVGIGLDMFLGADSPFYPALVQSIPLYLSKRFTPENIVPRTIETVLREDIFPEARLDGSTLDNMVYQGKILYAMDCVLPMVADTLKIGYTEAQLNWALAYQKDVWAWFLQEDLLYNTDQLKIQKYFNEAPFTSELGENNSSAPKLGTFIGWQMVKKYMKEFPETDLNTLLSLPPQQILSDSKFKGK